MGLLLQKVRFLVGVMNCSRVTELSSCGPLAAARAVELAPAVARRRGTPAAAAGTGQQTLLAHTDGAVTNPIGYTAVTVVLLCCQPTCSGLGEEQCGSLAAGQHWLPDVPCGV